MLLPRILLVPLVLAPTYVSASGMGVVGMGRTVFEPLCCYSCLTSFWGLTLSCSTAGGQRNGSRIQGRDGGEDGPSTSPSCHATSSPYLESLAYCISTKCSAEGVATTTAETCWSQVAGDGLAVSSLESNIPATIPTNQLDYNATSLTQASLVNDQYYADSRTTIQGYVKEESVHALYGVILILAVVGYCFLLGFVRLVNRYIPKLTLPRPISSVWSRYISKPALFGKRHLQKGPFSLGYIPSRAMSILIAGFFALNVALCLVDYPTKAVDTWYDDSSKEYISWLSNRLGVLAFANIALAIMFAGRNTPIHWITGVSRTEILTFHRWVARIATLQAVIHVVIYMGATNSDGEGMWTSAAGIRTIGYSGSYWSMGQFALGLMVVLAVAFSILPIRSHWYEIFLFVHIILAVGVLITIWEHVAERFNGIFGFETWIIVAAAFWGFDRIMRPLHLISLNYKNLSPSHPKPIVELLPGGEFIKVTVFPSRIWNFTAGQHMFLYFPSLKTNPFQSHPFTIATWTFGKESGVLEGANTAQTSTLSFTPEYNNNYQPPPYTSDSTSDIPLTTLSPNHPNQSATIPEQTQLFPTARKLSPHPSLSFFIRPSSGATKHLLSYLQTSKPSSPKIWIEGPYGPPPPPELTNANTILAIAGGIGITSILAFLTLYLQSPIHSSSSQTKTRNGIKATRFILYWTVRERSLYEAILGQLGDLDFLRSRGVEVRIFLKGEQAGRLDVKGVVGAAVAEEGRRKVCVVCCGPGGLADSVRAEVAKAGGGVGLVEEGFAW